MELQHLTEQAVERPLKDWQCTLFILRIFHWEWFYLMKVCSTLEQSEGKITRFLDRKINLHYGIS